MANLVTKMITSYADDAIKALGRGADKVDDAARVIQKRGAVSCYLPSEHRYYETLQHRVSDISATIRPDSGVGNLVHKSESIARITREQFEAMKDVSIIKTGTGKSTVFIDEFTGTSYYLADNGKPMMESATSRGNVSQDFWNKLLGLFS